MSGQLTTAKYKLARMSRRIAVDQNVFAWDGGHPGLTVWNLLNYTRIENAHKVRKKTFVFYYAIVTYTTTGKAEQLRVCLSRDDNPPELTIID